MREHILVEYRTISEGAIWLDRRDRGRLLVDGSDRVSFLQALVSNDVTRLAAGGGVYATYLTPQGRMVADLRLYDRGDSILAVVAPGLAPTLATTMDGVIFSEQVRIADVTADLAQLAVAGARAADVMARVFHVDLDRIVALAPLAHITSGDVMIARADDSSLPAYDVFVPASGWPRVVDALEAAGVPAGSRAIGETLRIEAGRPAYGVDMTTETIPLEAGLLERGISTTKGCYVGQEIIIRVLHRGGGRVAKRLVRLEIDPADYPPDPGAEVHLDGREVGRVTSVAFSPRVGRFIALGYVARSAAEPGQRLSLVFRGKTAPAEITALAG